MDRAAFEAALSRDRYDIVVNTMRPGMENLSHVHIFDARLLVVEGEMTVIRDDGPTVTHPVGAMFELQSGCRHSETAGASGATYVAGRRVPARKIMS